VPSEAMNIKLLTRYSIGIGIFLTFISLYFMGIRFRASDLNASTLFFIFWLMLPYIIWAYRSERRVEIFSKYPMLYIGFAIAMPTLGVSVLGYVSLNPDPQAGFYFVYLTLVQLLCLWAVLGVCKK
jgi:hypothetical protein